MKLRRLMVFSLLAGSFLSSALLPEAAHAAALTRTDVEGIVKDYLLSHPEVLVEAMKNYQTKQNAQNAEQAKKTMAQRKMEIFNDSSSPVAGNPKGDVTLVEFFDYHCGYCKKMLPVINQLIGSDKKLKVVFKEYPILSPDSTLAAKAALAVWRVQPDKYFAYHTALMGMSGGFTEDSLLDEAVKLGIDRDKVKKEMASPEVAAVLSKDQELASALGVHGTPAFLVGDQLIGGATSYEALKKQIDELRAHAPSGNS